MLVRSDVYSIRATHTQSTRYASNLTNFPRSQSFPVVPNSYTKVSKYATTTFPNIFYLIPDFTPRRSHVVPNGDHNPVPAGPIPLPFPTQTVPGTVPDRTHTRPKSFPTPSQSLPTGTRVASQSLSLPPIGCPLRVPVGPVPLPSYT